MALIKCPDCNKEISDSAPTCPNCGRPMATQTTQQILCPNCKSPNVEKISGTSKAGSALMWGVLAMGKLSKTYRCKKCGYRW